MDTAATTTRDQLIDLAQELIGKRGCNGFSYRDLADQVGVKTSSIHYYFPTKDDLLLEAIKKYSEETARRRQEFGANFPPAERLHRYISALECRLRNGSLLCLGGALAADFECVPGPVQKAIAAFFTDNEKWLADTMAEGQADGTLAVPGCPVVAARILFAAMQGATMTSRLFHDYSRVRELVHFFTVDKGHEAPAN